MSALAKKMMEKYGWKEGEGLGKERTGVKSYVKVTRRDSHTPTGLGHAADPAQGGSLASTHAVELDAIYGQLHKETKKRQRQSNKSRVDQNGSSEDEGDNADDISDASSTSSGAGSSSTESQAEGKVEVTPRATVKQHGHALPSSPSSSGSDGDDRIDSKRSKCEQIIDVTRMSDKELFQRCGGVRLGRAGRHRFFDGKLKRIQDSS